MQEIDSRWREYYGITDPVKRREFLDELLVEYGIEYEFARELYDIRFRDKKRPQSEVDRYLYSAIVFLSVERAGGIFKKGHIKEIKKCLSDMGCDLADTEQKKCLLYWEMRNAMKRYYETCNSPSYRRKFFGIVKSSDSEKRYFRLYESWHMSVGVSEKYGLKDEMSLWNSAVRAEYAMLEDTKVEDFDTFDGK